MSDICQSYYTYNVSPWTMWCVVSEIYQQFLFYNISKKYYLQFLRCMQLYRFYFLDVSSTTIWCSPHRRCPGPTFSAEHVILPPRSTLFSPWRGCARRARCCPLAMMRLSSRDAGAFCLPPWCWGFLSPPVFSSKTSVHNDPSWNEIDMPTDANEKEENYVNDSCL